MSKIITGLKLLLTPGLIVTAMGDNGLLKWMSDVAYLKLAFRGRMGKKLELGNPQSFSEKLQWLKLHDRNPLYHQLVDKYEVKRYVAEKIGEQYIIPTFFVWESVNDINVDILPHSFVLKCTHDSGSVVICKDKNNLNWKDAANKLTVGLQKDPFWYGREWVYHGVKPRIIAEQYMVDGSGELRDYKMLCFHGKVRLIEVHMGRYRGCHTHDYYTAEWKKTDIEQDNNPNSEVTLDKPECLDEMIRLSEKIAADMLHVRIDWYVINNRPFFGEITFFDGSGFLKFKKYEDDLRIGSWIHLPQEGK